MRPAFVDGDKVVFLVKRVTHHPCWIEFETAESHFLRLRHVKAIVFGPRERLLHGRNLLFKLQVALRKFLINLRKREESLYPRVGFVHFPGHFVGRRKPHAALIAVVLEQQHHAYYLKGQENKPVVVTRYECKEVAHAPIS